MKNCLALRHVGFENIGILEPLLRQRKWGVRYLEVGVEELNVHAVQDADLLIALGGPIGVYEEEAYPFIILETAAIAARVSCQQPTLGICLGAQFMAKALGAPVGPGPGKEIGWAPIELTAAGRASPLRHIADVPVLHWHGDNFGLPQNCENLAATASCPHQAFRQGTNLLGIQFHIETDPKGIEAWLIGHAVELSKAGKDPRVIREDTSRYGKQLKDAATKVLTEWLDGIEW
jgi:GMP synthase (glutamine-hydrolysing)